jgi:hypothetical protein
MSEVTHRPTRRLVLLGAAAASLAACTGDDPTPSPTAGAPDRTDPDALLRAEVTSAERDLLARYQATVAAHPALAAQLAPFSARHRRHLDAVETSGPVATPAPTSPGTGPPGTPSAAPTPIAPPAVPADPGQALTALRGAERAAADARVADCLRSEDPELAQLLAAVAACEAAHDVVLGTAS